MKTPTSMMSQFIIMAKRQNYALFLVFGYLAKDRIGVVRLLKMGRGKPKYIRIQVILAT